MLAANRTTITALAQQNELNSIIGLIKRSQMSYGALFAFSGANTMYRKQAVLDVGGWHAEQPTEDISSAWDMQTNGWRALFAPHIRFFLDVPEQTRSLVKQRRRWSSGGIYVLLSKGPALLRHPLRNYQMVPVILDYSLSVAWSFLYWVSMALFVLTQIYFAGARNWERFLHNWYMVGIFVGIEMVVGVLQLTAASYFNDGGRTLKYVLFAPWYMLVYWMVNTWTVVVEFLPTVGKVWALRDGGTWKSPERSSSLQGVNQGIGENVDRGGGGPS
jgi:cellulose synthase/poly-beta-1,6-N-acetylglucosamine synthase-like glycosyltransferase